MDRKSICACFLLLLAATSPACGGGGSSVDASGDDGGAPDGRDAAARTWTGSVYEARASSDGGTVPIEGAVVCLPDHPEIRCARSDAAGAYTIALPRFDSSAPFAVTFKAAGHLGRVSPAADWWWPSGVGLVDDAGAQQLATQAGFTYPARGTGFIELRLGGRPGERAGVTAKLTPSSGIGPIYADEAGRPDPAATSTSASGVVFFGNVAPGAVTIEVNAAERTCGTFEVSGIWPSTNPNTVVVPVIADGITDEVTIYCR
jgi:hypothetical protein